MLSLRCTLGMLGGAAFYMIMFNVSFHRQFQLLLQSPVEHYMIRKETTRHLFSSKVQFLSTTTMAPSTSSSSSPTTMTPSTSRPTLASSTSSPTLAPSTPSPSVAPSSNPYEELRVEGEHQVFAKDASQQRLRHGHDLFMNESRRRDKNETVRMCVRDDGEFARPYHDSFTGKRDWLENTCVDGGSKGTTLLYAKGGLGNQLHCMAVLQRIDPGWMALDHTPRPYLAKDFYERRQIPFDEASQNETEAKIRRGDLHLFPFTAKSIVDEGPGNCWLVAGFQDDACGPEEEAAAKPHETLRAKTAAAFASIPINPDLKRVAKEFVGRIMRGRKTLVAVHTRTGSLLVDGLKKWNETALRTYQRNGTAMFEWNYRGAPPPNYDTERLLDLLRNETRDIYNQTGKMPVVLISSDSPLVGLVLSYRLRGDKRPVEIDRGGNFRRPAYFESESFLDEQSRDDDQIRVVLTRRLWRSHREGLENDMVELLAMSHADVIVKDNFLRESTFSEAAWWLGGSVARRIMTPNNERMLLPECLRSSTDYNRPLPEELLQPRPWRSTKL